MFSHFTETILENQSSHIFEEWETSSLSGMANPDPFASSQIPQAPVEVHPGANQQRTSNYTPRRSASGHNTATGNNHTSNNNIMNHRHSSEYVNVKYYTSRSSLELRKLPVNVLLKPSKDDDSIGASSIDDSFDDITGGGRASAASATLLQKTCLNSHFSLRMQMMLSFGTVSCCSIILVVAVGMVASILAGDRVSDIAVGSFDNLAKSIAGTTAHYLSDDLTHRILPTDLVQILYEATRDRFAGYPIHEDDSQVPFYDIKSKSNLYPIQGKPLPLDWQMGGTTYSVGNVNSSNYYEHVQDRLAWYEHSPTLDTSSAAFFIQGMCDPSVANEPTDSRYFPNCTYANNDISTGGVVAPSPTTAQIHRKASDLTPLLKSLYEYHQDVKNIGVYFSNSGAGATAVFPHYELNYSSLYTSAGCSWMLDDHPLDKSRTFATLEDYERCFQNGLHVNGNNISNRLYNPMDREWCKEQALEPDKVHHVGPVESAWHPNHWYMTIGRAVYDRITNEFVACIAVDFVLDSVESKLKASKATENSEVSVVRFNDLGTVVASTAWNSTFATGTVHIDELNVGITQETYNKLYNLVDYNAQWDPDEVEKTYEQFLLHEQGYLVATYPMPPIPKTYKSLYEPVFLVVVSVAEDEFFKRSAELQDAVDETVVNLERIILIVGFVGLVLMVVIISMVARALTSPLTYMNDVAAKIIVNFGDTADDGGDVIEVDRKELDSQCVPRTELNEIVKEFSKMVENFSGQNMAKNAQEETKEIDNRFSLVDEFRDLYDSRSDPKFKYTYPQQTLTKNEKIEREGAPPHRLHLGPNISRDSIGSTVNTRDSAMSSKSLMSEKRMASPIFFWIVVLIVTPLLLTTITISCVVMVTVAKSFPDYVNEAKEHFVEEEKFALETYVGLRANLTAVTTERAIRDNHVLLRYSSWLLFGGLNRTSAFTELTSGVEDCKFYANLSECPYVQEMLCDCAWNDVRTKQCFDYEEDSRYLQKTMYCVESHDALPDGDRYTTSFPEVSFSQESTAWWDNVSEVPGSEKDHLDPNASRYDSLYDRLGIAAALPIVQLLYNYDVYKETTILGVYVAFEDDGLLAGYQGCSWPGHPQYAAWNSNVDNGAYDIRPELCPLGKYGYDPRCRSWYDKGKNSGSDGGAYVYASPPYLFAAADINAQSASSPLVDPNTGKHVGQTLIDFVSQPILDSLNNENFVLAERGFPILITIESDNFEADTVIGPGLKGEARPIAELVLPYKDDCEGDTCNEGFYEVLQAMKDGGNGTTRFTRMAEDGSREAIYISYAPVAVKSFAPVDSSDFSRGVVKLEYLLYSLAFAEFEEAMLGQFNQIEETIDTQFYIVLAILCLTIVLSTLFVVYFSNVITVSMTEPMLHLLELIRTINSLKDGEDRPEPPMDRRYGSREVLNVTGTMERLYKVIRSANTAFFAGDVETAYEVLMDALKLFKRLGNKKAIGVACNNLGNTMLAAYRTLKATKEKRICGFKKKEIIAKGTACFHEAIQQGEAAYDAFHEKEGWSPRCLDFMQHLSNRYFNRAMFLLTVKDDHPKPDEIQELGMRDLQISRDMDVEIVDEGTQVGWNVTGVDQRFDVMLSRFRGHLLLLEMGYSDELELEEWLDEAFQLLRVEMKNQDNSDLFAEVAPAGRMQQIETELMKYYEITGDEETAAKIAIRILVEDEYTSPAALLLSTTVLQSYVEKVNPGIRSDVKDALDVFRRRVETAVSEVDSYRAAQSEAGDNFSETASLDHGEILSKSSEFGELTQNRKISLMESSRGDITMEMF